MTATLVGYALRACLPRRRVLLGLLAVMACAVFGALGHVGSGDLDEAFTETAVVALFGLVLPIVAIVVGDAVLGAEIRSGTFAFTWLSPVDVRRIVVARWLAAFAFLGVTVVPGAALAAVAGGAAGQAVPVAGAVAASAAAYAAVLVVLGAATRRAVGWSLVFVFLVERVLGAAVGLVAQVSPGWLGVHAFVGWVDGDDELRVGGVPTGTAAAARLGVVVALALWIATRRLRARTFAGSASD